MRIRNGRSCFPALMPFENPRSIPLRLERPPADDCVLVEEKDQCTPCPIHQAKRPSEPDTRKTSQMVKAANTKGRKPGRPRIYKREGDGSTFSRHIVLALPATGTCKSAVLEAERKLPFKKRKSHYYSAYETKKPRKKAAHGLIKPRVEITMMPRKEACYGHDSSPGNNNITCILNRQCSFSSLTIDPVVVPETANVVYDDRQPKRGRQPIGNQNPIRRGPVEIVILDP